MADPHVLSISLLDDRGKVRAANYYVDSAATLTNIQDFVDAHLNKLEAVIGGVVQSIAVNFSLEINSPDNTVPVVDCPTSQGAIAAFAAEGTGYRHSIYLPTFRKTLITAGEIVVAGAVQTWIDSILGGESDVSITDKAGRDLNSFLGSRTSDRK